MKKENKVVSNIFTGNTTAKKAKRRKNKSRTALTGLKKQRSIILEQSDKKWLKIIEKTFGGVLILDINGNILEVDDATCKMLAYENEELSGKNVFDLLEPKSLAKKPPRYKALFSKNTVITERTIKRKDGSTLPIESTSTLLDNSRVISIVRDISDRKLAENVLRESEEFNRAINEYSPLGISVRTNTGQLLSCNESWKKIWAIDAKSIKEDLSRPRKKLKFDASDEYLGKWKPQVKKIYKEGGMLFIPEMKTKTNRNGVAEWISHYFYAMKNAKGKVDRIIILTQDITERKLAESALLETKELLEKITSTSPAIITVYDIKTGKNIYKNRSLLEMLGYPRKELINLLKKPGNELFSLVHPDDAKILANRDKIIPIMEDGKSYEMEYRLKDYNGNWQWIRRVFSVFHRDRNGKPTHLVSIFENITANKLNEEALKESEIKYKALFESANDALFLLKDFKIVDCNISALKLFDIKKEEMLRKSPLDFSLEGESNGKYSKDKVLELLKKASDGQKQYFEWLLMNSDGKFFDAEVSLSPIKIGGETYLQGILRDITVRKQVENLLRKLSSAVEQSPASVIITDTKGNIEYANTKFSEITGYKFEEIKGKNPRILKSGETPSEEYKRLWETITSGKIWNGVFHNKKKNGELFWETASISPIIDENGKIINFIAVKEDITEKKIKDEMLLQSLKEKEIMLKEIHHRVKNNLQIISSLLKLQSGYITDPVALEYFNISQNRVKSMALIHQLLYRSSDLSRICFEDYMFQLVNHLTRAYGVDTERILINIKAEDIYLGIDTAIPCGLLINELVSNSLKHAFPDNRIGKIEISMLDRDNMFTLSVLDDGIGFPDSIDFRNTQTLGMQLVITLTEQIEGNIEILKDTGTKFVITFPSAKKNE